jgi:hypothetical protein
MLQVARRMMQSKREMQEEIRQDIKKPEIRAAIDELLRRNEERRRTNELADDTKPYEFIRF